MDVYSTSIWEDGLPLISLTHWVLNTLRPRRKRRHLADAIFKCILLNENVLISIKIPLKCIPKGPINNIPALVQIMAWRRPGDKPLSEPMMVRLPTHICVTRPQWVNSFLRNIIICVHFLPFLSTKMVQVVEIFSRKGHRSDYPAYSTSWLLMLPHACWWPGDTRSQAINCHNVALVYAEYSGFSNRMC